MWNPHVIGERVPIKASISIGTQLNDGTKGVVIQLGA